MTVIVAFEFGLMRLFGLVGGALGLASLKSLNGGSGGAASAEPPPAEEQPAEA